MGGRVDNSYIKEHISRQQGSTYLKKIQLESTIEVFFNNIKRHALGEKERCAYEIVKCHKNMMKVISSGQSLTVKMWRMAIKLDKFKIQ